MITLFIDSGYPTFIFKVTGFTIPSILVNYNISNI